MVIGRKVRVIGLTLLTLFILYVLLGFFAVPPLVKSQLKAQVEQKLKHKLELGQIRFNPLNFTAEVNGFDLREPTGGALLGFKRLFLNFQARSVYERAWTFAEVSLDGATLNGELRDGGIHNFSALLAALQDPEPKPATDVPRIIVDRIAISDATVDLADRQAGESARLRLAPIAFELTELSTLPDERSPYKLTARTVDGELLQWGGEISLNPVASTGKLVLSQWRVATLTRLLGDRIAIDAPSGEIDASLSYRSSYARGRTELAIADLAFKLSGLKLVTKGGTEPLAAAESFDIAGVSFDLGSRSITLDRIALAKASLALKVDDAGRANWKALVPGAAVAPVTTAGEPAPPAVSPSPASGDPATAPWHVKLGAMAITGLDLKYADRRPASQADIALNGISLTLSGEGEQRAETGRISLGALKLTATGGKVAHPTQTLAIQGIEVSANSMKSERSATGADLDLGNVQTVLAGVALKQGNAELNLQKLALDYQALRVKATANAMQIALDGPRLDSAEVGARLDSAKHDVLELRTLSAGAQTVIVAVADAVPDIKASGLSGNLAGILLRDPAGGHALARLGKAQVHGGTVSLRDRQASIDRIELADGHAAAVMRADGKLNWDALLAVFAPPAAKSGAPASGLGAGAAWKAVAKSIDLRNFGAAYSDERHKPALGLDVQAVHARVRNAGTDRTTAAQVEINGRIKDGGQFSAAGRVNLHSLASDLKIKVADLSLTPVQPLLAQYARIELLSALAAAEGRVRYDPSKGADAGILFEGDLALSKLAIDETEPKQPFLALDTLRASEVRLALAPHRLEIPELRIVGLATKLVIAEDQSVNIAKLARPRAAAGTPAAAPSPAAGAAPADPEFPISISRIRIDQARLEFADLSLRPQFATRMHELQGVITGVSTSRDSRAQMELDARVDEFGSARIKGEINPFQPRVYTDIDMVFRNLEMTALTPYSAKFAGYRIASGRLSMDLQYKIKNGALLGENKLVLDKLELGERVESPTALNLPLELAIAILKDSDGRIDIGLPVSGSLDDPQFSYGALIWKAIGNLLTRIVTAPFRALANLFGGSAEALGAIEFDPGGERLLPPERQKLRTVAEALQKRPQLKLTVKPAYAPDADRPALQSLAARRAVYERAGVKLQADELPGPLDYGNSRMQQAIQALFEEKFTLAAARDLRAEMAKAAAAQPPAEAAKTAPKPAGVAVADVARAMAARLVGAYTIDDAALAELARRRGATIATELREAGKIDPARLAVATPQVSNASAGKPVVIEMELGVAK